MKDFTCCGLTLSNLHELLQHYEEAHTQPSPNTTRSGPFSSQFAPLDAGDGPRSSRPSIASTPGQNLVSKLAPNRASPGMSGAGMASMGVQMGQPSGLQQQAQMTSHMDEMDTMGDMDMDDAVGHMELEDDHQRTMHQTRQMFGQQQRPQLQVNASGLTQGLRTSQPTTPAAANFGLQNNPTVSSVNTPTLSTHQSPLQQGFPPDNQMDSMDEDMPGMPMGGNMDLNGVNFGDLGFGNNNVGNANANGNNGNDNNNANPEFCINDPGKHLSSPGGAPPNQQRSLQSQLLALGFDPSQPDSPTNAALIAKYRAMMANEEHKPFKCPVIGCEKAYKNQNGLK